MPCWMKKMPVDSRGSTKPLDRPMATQFLTQELRLRPIRILMWLARQWSAAGRIAGIDGPVDRDRMKGNLSRGTVASIEVRPTEGGKVTGDRLVLFLSHLRRPAPVYEPLERFPIGAG